MADAEIFRATYSSARESIPESIREALTAIEESGWITSRESRFAFRLCLEEAIVNAVQHGNGCNPDRKFTVIVSKIDAGGRITVEDEGKGFSPEGMGVPDEDCPGGRGVCLMKFYMDHVSYDKATHRLEMDFSRMSPVTGGGCNG